MADRYTYVPGLGPFLLAVVAVAWTEGRMIAVKKHVPLVAQICV